MLRGCARSGESTEMEVIILFFRKVPTARALREPGITNLLLLDEQRHINPP